MSGSDGSADPPGTIRWRVLHAEARERLAGISEAPEAEARWLVEEATGADPGEFSEVLETLVTERRIAAFDRMLERRCAGEPIQYVLGRWAFRTVEVMVDRRVLIPRPETEIVAGVAIEAARGRPDPLVVDLGTGSGVIALAVASEVPTATVVATDCSADALAVARANLAGLGRAATRVTMVEGDWFTALDAQLAGRVTVIVSNPPYVAPDDELPASVAEWEPGDALVAADAGFADLGHLIDQAPDWLTPGGVLVLELAPGLADRAVRAAEARGFVDVDLVVDLAGHARALVAHWPGPTARPARLLD